MCGNCGKVFLKTDGNEFRSRQCCRWFVSGSDRSLNPNHVLIVNSRGHHGRKADKL